MNRLRDFMGVSEDHLETLINDNEWVKWFESKLKKKGECLLWQGTTDKSGYGRFHVKRHCERPTGRNFFAHRAAYAVQTGEILEQDEYILHQCNTRLCCNSDCFEIGDHDDNMDDLRKSGNIAGELNPKSKLTEIDVWDILEMYYDEKKPTSVIVKEYEDIDVRIGTISDIVYGRTWRSVYQDFMGMDE